MFKILVDYSGERLVWVIRVLGCFFNILYNMVRKIEEVKLIVDYEVKEILVYFVKLDILIVVLLVLLSLVYVVDEESN